MVAAYTPAKCGLGQIIEKGMLVSKMLMNAGNHQSLALGNRSQPEFRTSNRTLIQNKPLKVVVVC